MVFTPGSRLGAYEILTLIGSGGMGEVYRARDTRLGRDVAIKILPSEVAADSDRLARFEREAQVLASLNHQNIAHIHGVEDSTGVPAFVMELVEGPTLAHRIAQGLIPIDEALGIAKQIAEALDAAHEKGIIHRDLKPANIALTNDGQVKVLDFGLAKAVETTTGSFQVANSPTITSPAMMTAVGVILGTAAYMAPEQAKGRPADKRSDIWAFGCVLYEMLTARRAFEGDDVGDTLANILKTEPDWSALPSTVSAPVRAFLARCLRKNPSDRIAGLSAFLFLVTEPNLSLPPSTPGPRSQASRGRLLLGSGATAIVAAALVALLAWTLRQTPSAPVVRLELTLPEAEPSVSFNFPAMAISPDGTQIAFAADNRLYRRVLSELVSQPINGTEDDSPSTPVFSPDGRSLVFRSNRGARGALKKVPTAGGSPITLATDVGRGATWDAHGIVFVQYGKGVVRVSPDGGTPELLISLSADEDAQGPQMLPDDRTVLFTMAPPAHWERAQVVVQTIGSHSRKVLIDDGAEARYLPTGQLVYARGASLLVVRFDLKTLTVKDSPIPVVDGVRRAVRTAAGTAQYAISRTGTLAYWPGRASSMETSLALIDRHGAITRLKLPPGQYEYPRISPDGAFVTFQTENAVNETTVWVYELAGTSAMRRLTFGGKNRWPLWSADGRRIAFQSDRGGDLGVHWTAADGSAVPERLTTAEPGTAHVPESWSPDGATLLYSITSGPRVSLQILSLADRKSRPFPVESATPTNAVFSPNGRWVAYTSTEREFAERIYIQPFPPTGTKFEIPPVAGDNPHDPLWSHDGGELFYVPRVGGFNVISVRTQPTVVFGNPTRVVRAFDVAPNTTPRTFDLAPDGRFLGLVPPDPARAAAGDGGLTASLPTGRIEVVINWFEELKRLVPVK